MTYKVWEKKLRKYLSPLPKEEREAAAEYYREIYEDKTEAGELPESVLAEFGSPKDCAEKLLAENGKSLPSMPSANANSVASMIGMFFLTVLIVIPLFAAAISIVAAFASVAVAGVVTALAGAIFTVASPFFVINGASFGAILAQMGMGVAACGVGVLLAIAFAFITKYSFIYLMKGTVAIYKRRNNA